MDIIISLGEFYNWIILEKYFYEYIKLNTRIILHSFFYDSSDFSMLRESIWAPRKFSKWMLI